MYFIVGEELKRVEIYRVKQNLSLSPSLSLSLSLSLLLPILSL